MTFTSRTISFFLSSNKKPPSPPYCIGSKIKALLEERSNEELPAGVRYDSSYSTLIIADDLNMGDMSGGNCYLNNYTLYQQYCDYNNDYVSSGYGFKNSHTLYQCEDYSTF